MLVLLFFMNSDQPLKYLSNMPKLDPIQRAQLYSLHHEAGWSYSRLSKHFRVAKVTCIRWCNSERNDGEFKDLHRSGRKCKYGIDKKIEINRDILESYSSVRQYSRENCIPRTSVHRILKSLSDPKDPTSCYVQQQVIKLSKKHIQQIKEFCNRYLDLDWKV